MNLRADRGEADYHIINSDLAVLPHPRLIVPSQMQHPLSGQKARCSWSENAQSAFLCLVILTLPFLTFAFFLFFFFLPTYLFSAGVLR